MKSLASTRSSLGRVASLTALLLVACNSDAGEPATRSVSEAANPSAPASGSARPGAEPAVEGSTAGHAGPVKAWFDGSFDEGVAQAKATKQHVFVDFFTTWCPPCKKLDKETFSQAEVQTELAKMISISLDAESPAGIPVAKKYRVTGYPTLLVVDGNGKEVGRMVGFHDPEKFLAKLAEIRARPAR